MEIKSENNFQKYRDKVEEISGKFIESLQQLQKVDRGSMAILRRNVGNTIGQSHNAMSIIYSLLPYELDKDKHEETFFMIATLFAMHPKASESGSIAYTIKIMKEDYSEKTLDMRLRMLLDEELFQNISVFSRRLRQLIQMAKSKDYPINYRNLLADLMSWEHPKRFIQKEWAKTYYQQNLNNKGDKE